MLTQMYVRIKIKLRTNIRYEVKIMILNQLWDKYSYVILLFAIGIICGLMFINTLISNGHEGNNQENYQTEPEYAINININSEQ